MGKSVRKENIKKANNYIVQFKGTVNNEYRQHYHMMPPIGWLNDPNGLVYFTGRYHLYYQFNPYASRPGQMCWGHFVSEDLIDYYDDGVALKPDIENASAYSGGAIEHHGNIHAFYTLHVENGDEKTEEVYKAVSESGFSFGKGIKVFDNEYLPENISRTDFRDPCPMKIGDMYYVLVGGKDINLNAGVIVVLSGRSTERLHYAFTIGPFYELGNMGECPSWFRIGDKDVLVVSGCAVPQRDNDFKNVNSSVFIVGEIDFKNGSMKVDYIKEIDKGDAFYAPQFIRGADSPIMIGWLEMWERKYFTSENNHGWVGAFSIPREISIKDGDIFQTPVHTLDEHLHDTEEDEVPRCADMHFTFKGDGKLTIEGENGSVSIIKDGEISVDTTESNNLNGCVRKTNKRYDKCEIRVLLDVSSIEVFIDGGREVISSRIYIDGDYTITKSGDISDLTIKEIGKKR